MANDQEAPWQATDFRLFYIGIRRHARAFLCRDPWRQSSNANAARGKYLVENVARCGDCHSPHDAKGAPLPGKELRGAPLMFKPITPPADWADKAPNIAGLRAWETADAVKFLMTESLTTTCHRVRRCRNTI